MNQYLTVTELNKYISELINRDQLLREVWLRGELSGCKLYRQSGHLYFTLKDESSVLSGVMFKTSASGLSFQPEDGMDVLVRGSISVYGAQGRYQIYAREMQPAGLGAIYLYIEKLKVRLAAAGLFDENRKRPIPPNAFRIGIVSSRDSAAVQDMLRILQQRCPFVEIILAHSSVQGMEAPAELVKAIQQLNRLGGIDVIIIGRGGGSIEDLMAFNSEELVQAVYNSAIPTISAVGHETDFTLCDLAADLRAATPTHAAQLAVPDYSTLDRELKRIRMRMLEAINRRVQTSQEKLDRLMMGRIWQNPESLFDQQQLRLDRMNERLVRAVNEQLNGKEKRLALLSTALDQLNPLKILSRGYSIVYTEAGGLVHHTGQVRSGEMLRVRLQDGNIQVLVESLLQEDC